MDDVVALEVWRDGDWPLLEAWAADPELGALVGGDFPAERRGNVSRLYAIRLDGRLIGWVELLDIRMRAGTAELRIAIGERSAWNRGYGRRAVRLAVDMAFRELGLRLVYLRVLPENRRAVRCYLHSGFEKRGRLRPGRRREEGHRPLLLMEARREAWLAGERLSAN